MIDSLKHAPAKNTRPSRRELASPWPRRTAAVVVLLATSYCAAEELSVKNFRVRPNGNRQTVVSVSNTGESTFDATIMLDWLPRPGSVERVEFTPTRTNSAGRRGSVPPHAITGRPDNVRVTRAAPTDVDVAEIADPRPYQGSFSPFAIHPTESPVIYGVMGDNGVFMASPVVYHGTLSVRPIRVSSDARVVWEATLATTRGSSVGGKTSSVLHNATTIFSSKACASGGICIDDDVYTVHSCDTGLWQHDWSNNSCMNGKRKGKQGSFHRP